MGSLTNKMGLATWDQPLDPYSYQQFSNNWQIVDFHDHSPGRGVQIPGGGIAVGSIAPSHLAPSTANLIGTGAANRGFSYNAGIGTRANAVNGPLNDAADQVSNLVIPVGGLLNVAFHAWWTVTSTFVGTASITLNNVNVVQGTVVNATPPAYVSTTSTQYGPLYTNGTALQSPTPNTVAVSEVTTGTSVGGTMPIYAAPGTYNVAVQWSVTAGGTVSAQNRHLWVWVQSFG